MPAVRSEGILSLARAVVPQPARRWLRRAAREAPHRLRDFPKDAVAALIPRAFGGPMPPPGLRARVGLGSRDEFVLVGREGARQIVSALDRAPVAGRARPDWLDFGCGCGRIARFLLESPGIRSYTGVDVDVRQVAWAARHLPGRFGPMRPDPPLDFPESSFDVVLAISIFTHFDEVQQLAWLTEIRRILKPGGVLVATTLGPQAAPACPGLTPAELGELARRGFLAADHGATTFNEHSTFHSREYLEATWSRFLDLRDHEPRGFVSYQDLAVWEKAPPARS
jgi:SAM-dependent methyltransferase